MNKSKKAKKSIAIPLQCHHVSEKIIHKDTFDLTYGVGFAILWYMKYTDYTNTLVGTMWVKRPATVFDMRNHVPQLLKWQRFGNEERLVCTTNNRNRYWFCWCVFCGTPYVLRSDYIRQKKCKCRRK